MLDNVICKKCGTPAHTIFTDEDYYCIDCKIENMHWMTLEEYEAHMKRIEKRNNSWRKQIDGFDLDL